MRERRELRSHAQAEASHNGLGADNIRDVVCVYRRSAVLLLAVGKRHSTCLISTTRTEVARACRGPCCLARHAEIGSTAVRLPGGATHTCRPIPLALTRARRSTVRGSGEGWARACFLRQMNRSFYIIYYSHARISRVYLTFYTHDSRRDTPLGALKGWRGSCNRKTGDQLSLSV